MKTKRVLRVSLAAFLLFTTYVAAEADGASGEKAPAVNKAGKILVTNIKANVEYSDTTYPILLEDDLQDGKPVYSTAISGDKRYKDAGEFAGLQYLRTDSRWWNLEIGNKFLEFDIDKDATIYVACFKKLKSFDNAFSKDHWLMSVEGGWKDLHKDILVADKTDQPYGVFAKTLKAGHVTLPANAMPGFLTGVYAHYLVFIGPPVGEPKDNVIPTPVVPGKIPAFSGAEGGGMYATGGRGGEVYEVTNLEDYSGREAPMPGSLRDAVSKPNRTVVFRISGTIVLKSSLQIKADNITIAGQTAPGDGIAVKAYPLSIAGNNKIIRFIRSRPGDETDEEFDSFGGCFGNQIICDHISAAWSTDEAASFRYVKDFTFQWSVVGESNLHAHHKSGAHGFGGIWGGRNATYHHNLVLHNVSRMPRFNQGPIDFRNNVFYNWGYKAEYGDYNLANFVGNYYKPGNGTLEQARSKFAEPLEVQPWRGFGMYLNGNIMEGSEEVTRNNLLGAFGMSEDKRYILLTEEVPFPSPVKTQIASAAFETVLKYAGASPDPAKRDAVDMRFVNDARNGTGSMIYTRPATLEFAKDETQRARIEGTLKAHKARMVKIEYPLLKSATPPMDTDHDGMPDEWEVKHGLNPKDPADRNGDNSGDGYTNLEKYLNELAAPAMPPESEYATKIVLEPVDLSVLKGMSSPEAQAKCDVIVTLNGNAVTGNAKARVMDHTVLIPLDDLFKSLGFQVTWNAETQTATCVKDGKKIEIPTDRKQGRPEENTRPLAMVARLIDGRPFVPAQFLQACVGAKVVWDQKNRVLMISTAR